MIEVLVLVVGLWAPPVCDIVQASIRCETVCRETYGGRIKCRTRCR